MISFLKSGESDLRKIRHSKKRSKVSRLELVLTVRLTVELRKEFRYNTKQNLFKIYFLKTSR